MVNYEKEPLQQVEIAVCKEPLEREAPSESTERDCNKKKQCP